MHIIHKTLPTYNYDYTDNFDTHFRPLPEVVAYDPYFVDLQYGLDPYCDEEIYDQDRLEYKDTYNKLNDQVECDDLITDAHVSDALRYAVIDSWTINPELPDTSPLPNFRPRQQNQQRQAVVSDDQILPQLQVTSDGLTGYLPLSTNLPLKNKLKMLYFPMDFGELNIDGLIDTGASSSDIPEADLRKIRLLAPHTILNEGPPPEFQIMAANGQLEAPIATVELQLEVGDITFREKFIVMTNLTSPLIRLLFLQRNSTILDMRQGILNFTFFSMQLKNEDRTYPNVIEPIINPVDTILQPGKRTTIWVKSQIYTENEATGIIQPSPFLKNDEDLLICPAISSTQNNKHMVQISNFLDHPYTLKKGTHMENFSILTPEQTKHIRPVNPTSVRHLLNSNQDDAIHYLNSLLKTELPELPPSGGYGNVITAIDVFSRYAFAYPVSNPTAVNTAKVIIYIMTRHAYLPTLIITDKGSVFVSQVIHEVAEILGINLKLATTKHAQTIGVLERAHATIKTSLKMASGEYRKQWDKNLPIAILNYNTTYHSSIDCEPSRVFHGRVPHNILDHKLGLRFNPNIAPTTDFAEELLRRTKILYDKTKKCHAVIFQIQKIL